MHPFAREAVATRRLSLLCCLVAIALTLTACDDEGGPTDTLLLNVPSPEWEDQVIYFVLTDRFEDGDPTNNDQGFGEYDPEDFRKYSGGDLQGIIDRLDYIQGLGATALWITPPVANQWWDPLAEFGGYHGYWGRHFKRVDEHYGTMDTYRALSDALHQRGMHLIQDIVPNHTGNFFTYEGEYNPDDVTENFVLNTETVPTTAPEQSPFDMNDVTNPEHREAAIYHWTPEITDYEIQVQSWTWQTSDLDDINTENPVVREALRDTYGFWIREVGVDGFRVDTARHIEHPFWNDFIHSTDADVPGINAVAAETGRDTFLTFGETFESSDPFDDAGEVAATSYLGTAEVPELMSVLEFPLYFETKNVFGGGRPTAWMSYRLGLFMDPQLFPDPHRTPTFIDNHDVARFLQGASMGAFRQALMFLMTIPGIPIIYYGTGQDFIETRASMFAEGWGSGGEDHFDPQSETYQLIADLVAMRRGNAVLTRGDLAVLLDSSAGSGVLAYRRSYEDDEAIIVFNTADERVLLSGLDTGLDGGTRLEALHTMELEGDQTVRSDGTLQLDLPPRAALVLLATDDTSEPPTPAATVTIDTAIEGETLTEDLVVTGSVDPAGTDLVMLFDDYLDRATVVEVDTDGSFSVTLPISAFPIGQSTHTVTFYAAAAEAASPRFSFVADVPFEGEIYTFTDPVGDDTGPEGTYTYPDNRTFTNQMDITDLVLEVGAITLTLRFTMVDHTTVWNPPNGFDHVSFTIYFDVPGVEGLTMLPKIHATAPEDFAWDFTHFASGWINSLFGSEGATETEWGTAVAGAPDIEADEASRMIAFSYDRNAFGLDSWEGVSIYVTTWDYDGIDNRYRPLIPGDDPWMFGGGEPDDPFIMDDLGPVEIPVANGQ